MKTFIKLTAALFAFGFATANAQLTDAQKTIIAGVVATANAGNQEDTIEAVRAACKNNESIAADIVTAVIIEIGGPEADPVYVGKIVAAAIKGAPDKSEAIIAAALAAAPHATEQINTSANGGGGNPLQQNGAGGGGGGGTPPSGGQDPAS